MPPPPSKRNRASGRDDDTATADGAGPAAATGGKGSAPLEPILRDRSHDLRHKWSCFNSQAARRGIVQQLAWEQFSTSSRCRATAATGPTSRVRLLWASTAATAPSGVPSRTTLCDVQLPEGVPPCCSWPGTTLWQNLYEYSLQCTLTACPTSSCSLGRAFLHVDELTSFFSNKGCPCSRRVWAKTIWVQCTHSRNAALAARRDNCHAGFRRAPAMLARTHVVLTTVLAVVSVGGSASSRSYRRACAVCSRGSNVSSPRGRAVARSCSPPSVVRSAAKQHHPECIGARGDADGADEVFALFESVPGSK
jgi:hypothetical protein